MTGTYEEVAAVYGEQIADLCEYDQNDYADSVAEAMDRHAKGSARVIWLPEWQRFVGVCLTCRYIVWVLEPEWNLPPPDAIIVDHPCQPDLALDAS